MRPAETPQKEGATSRVDPVAHAVTSVTSQSLRVRYRHAHLALLFFSLHPLFIFATRTNTSTMAANPDFLKYVDEHQDDFIQRLKSAVEIPS